MVTDLRVRQIELEQSMADDAKLRVDNDNRKSAKRNAWSESKLGVRFTRSATSAFVEAVREFINLPSGQGRSHNRAAIALKKTGMEPEVIAYLFTKSLFNALPLAHRRRIKRVSLSIKAADLIHDEYRLRFFAQEDSRKALLRKLFKTFDARTYPRDWRKRTIMTYFQAEQLDWQAWTLREKLVIGYSLLVLFRNATGLIAFTGNDGKFIEAQPALLEEFEKTVKERTLEFMLYKPMVVKPLPWTESHLYRGGYLSTKLTRRYPIIKGAKKRDVLRMLAMDWSKILPPLNAIQETGWRVNKTMLSTLSWVLFEKGGDIAGLPPSNPRPLPPAPFGYGVDEEITKAHDKVCFLVHSFNREIISKRMAAFSTLTIANQFKDFEAIYFPHNLDSRGRAYPLPAFLNPQGPDYVKALLEFSEGKSIDTDEQAAWLAVAGANAYGKDKISLQERVDWVQDNDELIFSIATDPCNDLRWTEASEPFQFLRFCLEWNEFWHTGFGFVSHMVVPVDATCSGLQHYSAMLRDEVGGRSVNLVPHLPRQDIYQDVADVVIEELMDAAQKFDHPNNGMAIDWIRFGIDRKTTKRQVMVVPYAGTFSSCMEYTRDAVNEKLKDGHQLPWSSDDPSHNDRVVYLAKLIWNAIDKVVIKGKEAMRWLSEVARAYTRVTNKLEGTAHSKRMSWVTPDGFEAIHYRPDDKKKRADTYLDGRVNLTYYEETDKLNASNMALAVAPNFVHSLDAALLRMSVMKALDLNLTTSFGMVHDSFGVHAADMSVFLSRCVKPAFIEMYQRDVLADFRDRLPEGIEIPDQPKMGKLDLNGVTESEFFFS
jgi:DNA-directed RNA polymerase